MESLVSRVKTIGTNSNIAKPASQQQTEKVVEIVKQMNKGGDLSVFIENNSGARKSFLLFDAIGLAAASGAVNENADLDITTTFAGGVAFSFLKELIKAGTRLSSVGMVISWSDETIIAGTKLKVWNGNLEDYAGKSAQNALSLARDTGAFDKQTRVLNTAFWINPYFALGGSIPDGAKIEILFNISGHGNF